MVALLCSFLSIFSCLSLGPLGRYKCAGRYKLYVGIILRLAFVLPSPTLAYRATRGKYAKPCVKRTWQLARIA